MAEKQPWDDHYNPKEEDSELSMYKPDILPDPIKIPEGKKVTITKSKREQTLESLGWETKEVEQLPEPYHRKDWETKKEYNPDILYLSQSLMKSLINHKGVELDVCGLKLFHTKIKGDMKIPATQSMDNGTFAETLALGSGRDGTQILDLPRGTKMQKKADQLKIEWQVNRFRTLCKQHGIDIVPGYNTQISITKHFRGNVFLKGELDIFPVQIMWQLDPFIGCIDFKLSGDVNSTFGDFCWGAPEYMDHLQGDMYLNLMRDIDFSVNDEHNPGNHLRELIDIRLKKALDAGAARFMYWVFGYRCKQDPDLLAEQFNHIERVLDDTKQRELQQRIERSISIIKMKKDEGWVPNPTIELCKKCPLSAFEGGSCTEAISGNIV